MKSKFSLGDRVITTGYAYYEKNVPIGAIGTIVKIRNRYSGSACEYNQYKVEFLEEKYFTSVDSLDNLYTETSLALCIK
jgi:hypothetical protein